MKDGELRQFQEICLVDFEFSASEGGHPQPSFCVAWELHSGRRLRMSEDELHRLTNPPYDVSRNSLFVAYYASAELGCHLSLGWPMPANVLDLCVEFKNITNGRPVPAGRGLLGALAYYGLDSISAIEKDSMRALALRGGPWSKQERDDLLDYCESDVAALSNLLGKMAPAIDLPRALLRGRYMTAAARIERTGVPIDTGLVSVLRENWNAIKDHLIRAIDSKYGVFEGRTFKLKNWERWLLAHRIPWPRLASGALAMDDDTFREMARIHPDVAPMRELRVSLSQMRLSELAVGPDGRNRCLLSAFSSKTGRNQPSNKRFIFGPAVWMRSLILPGPGWGLAYIDWSQQEFGIAAALSGDENMITAYESGDPYLAFAVKAGAAPPGAMKETHGMIREQFKACALAVQYGMGAESLAVRIGQPVVRARELLEMHHRTFKRFWTWSDGGINHGMLRRKLWTVFGWTIHAGVDINPRTLRNFLMQANGAEILRLACTWATEAGIHVCAPVHDALLLEARLEDLDEVVRWTQAFMARASAEVLGGFLLRSEAKLIRYPERYIDPRGERMWNTIMTILRELGLIGPDHR